MFTAAKQKDRVSVLYALIAALIVQLAGVALLSGRSMNMDSIEYLELSESIAMHQEYSVPAGLNGYETFQGESPTRMRQPVYPLFLALLRRTPDNSVFPIQVLQALMNCLSLWLVFAIADSIPAFRLSRFSALMPVVYFPWLILSTMVLSETLFTLIMWIAVFMLSRYILSHRKVFLVSAGVFLGLLVLAKSIGLAVGLAFMVPLVAFRGFQKGAASWLIAMGIAAVVVAPWAVRNQKEMGVFTVFPSNSGYNLWVASRPVDSQWWDEADEFQTAVDGWRLYYIDSVANENFRRRALDNFSASSPFTVAGRAFHRWISAWFRFPGTGSFAGWNIRYAVMTFAQTVFMGLAIFGALRVRQFKSLLVLMIPVFALSLCLPVTKGLTRYLLPGWPPVAMLAGHGLDGLLSGRRDLPFGKPGQRPGPKE